MAGSTMPGGRWWDVPHPLKSQRKPPAKSLEPLGSCFFMPEKVSKRVRFLGISVVKNKVSHC